MFEELMNSINGTGLERFQEGLFTAFYAIEKSTRNGNAQEGILAILKMWEKEYKGIDDYKNLVENYSSFKRNMDNALDIFNEIKK